jgi:hypothetical protein
MTTPEPRDTGEGDDRVVDLPHDPQSSVFFPSPDDDLSPEKRLVWTFVAATLVGDELGAHLLAQDFLESGGDVLGVLSEAVGMLANSLVINTNGDKGDAILAVRQFLAEKGQ